MNVTPLVSILMPAFNAASYIAESIQSILAQTYQNWELIVVNDGSNDQTLEIAKSFEADSRIKIISQKNAGASAARNTGLKNAKGEYVQFFDADDILAPTKIEMQLTALLQSGSPQRNLSVCGTCFFKRNITSPIFDEYNRRFLQFDGAPHEFLLNLYGGSGQAGMVQTNAWLVPISIVNLAGPWNENLSLDDDGEFFCRVVLNADKIIFTDQYLNYYRKHDDGSNLATINNRKKMASALEATKLKAQHLSGYSKKLEFRNAFGRQFSQLEIIAYPRFYHISKKAKRMRQDYQAPFIYSKIGSKRTEALRALLGWKAAKSLLFIRDTLLPHKIA